MNVVNLSSSFLGNHVNVRCGLVFGGKFQYLEELKKNYLRKYPVKLYRE